MTIDGLMPGTTYYFTVGPSMPRVSVRHRVNFGNAGGIFVFSGGGGAWDALGVNGLWLPRSRSPCADVVNWVPASYGPSMPTRPRGRNV